MFLPKDFIETAEGLVFAVVAHGLENEKARCFLRYVRVENGRYRKVHTDEANELLATSYPHYRFHSHEFDAFLHAVHVKKIAVHHKPTRRLEQLLKNAQADEIEKNCVQLCQLLMQAGVDLAHFGVTGSLLIGQQKASSDIDLVCYDVQTFHDARTAVSKLIEQNLLSDLTHHDWQESYARRDCDLSFENYVWHEKRKANKGMIQGRKFDLSLVEHSTTEAKKFSKLGKITLQTQITDATRAFCYPAEFELADSKIQKAVCFTATYVGQAITGECVEISGQLEQDEAGNQRIVVGSNREARGEYIYCIC